MKTTIRTALAFFLMVAAPQLVKAQDVAACLGLIAQSWPLAAKAEFRGETRHKTGCQLNLQQTGLTLNVEAIGNPLHIQFALGNPSPEVEQNLLSCKVDKEKLHIVLEEKYLESFERRDRTQLTLLKRHGKGFSMILSKKETRLLRPNQQSNLICHLDY